MATHRRPGRRTLGIALVGSFLLGAAVVSPSSAGGSGGTVVRGIQLAYGTCGDGTGYAMTGALVGCWWIDTFDVHKPASTDKSHYMATGVEHFTGWIGSNYGTFTTTYRFTAKTDGPWPTSAEIHGRCHHPITGGEGDFAGITGELSFHDVVDVAPPYYPYRGSIRLGGGATLRLGATSTSSATSSSADSTTC